MSELTQKQQRIVRSAQRAGLKASRKQGHTLSKDEVLQLKVQVAPAWARWLSGLASAVTAWGSWTAFGGGSWGWGVCLAFLALLLLGFAFFGVRRTFSKILDSLEATAQGAEAVGRVVDAVFSVLGALSD